MQKLNNIVLLHGWGANVSRLGPLAAELEALRWNVLVPPLPGFDLEPPGAVWGVDDYADYALAETRRAFGGEPFVIFGHSFGGRLAVVLAARDNPDVQGVVFCAAAGLARERSLKRIAFGALAKAGKLLPSGGATAKIRRLFYRVVGEHDYEKTSGVMREVFKRVIAEDLRPRVPRIHLPVLILWGENDRATPVASAHLLAKTIPGSRLVVFSGQGHRLPYEKAQDVAAEITQWHKQSL